MGGPELLLEYLTKYFPILFFVVIALTFGNVAENKDDAGDFVFGVANRGGDLLNDVFAALS